MELFNTREIAIAIWTLPLIIWLLYKRSLRRSLYGVLKSFFVKAILVSFALMISYILLLVYFLQEIGLWEFQHLKNTIFWAMAVASVSMFRLNSISDDQEYFKTALKDNLKLIVILEFIVSFYTFGLIAELVIVPTITFLTILLAVSETNEEYKIVENFLSGIMALIGISLVVFAGLGIATGFDEFANRDTFLEFILPPALSALFLPFPFAMLIFMNYENAFIRLQFSVADPSIQKYAKKKALLNFGLRREHLNRWLRYLQSRNTLTQSDIDDSISEFKVQIKREEEPEEISLSRGWSPYNARAFLEDMKVKMGHYEFRGGDFWSACSSPLELDDEVLANNITYYIEGSAALAIKLELLLNVNYKESRKTAHEEFLRLARILCEKSLEAELPNKIRRALSNGKTAASQLKGKSISVEKDDWPKDAFGEYDIKFVIENS